MKTNIFGILTFFCVAVLIGISGSQVFGQDVNLALQANNSKVTATQSSMNEWRGKDNSGASFVKVGGSAAKAIDGNTKGSLWDEKIVETVDNDGWFEVDLGDYYSISKIVIHPRTDNCCTENFKPILIVSDQPINKPMTDEDRKSVRQSAETITDNKFGTPMTDDARIAASSTFYKYFTDAIASERSVMLTDKDGKETPQVGRYVRLQMKGWGGNTRIELAELEIFGKKESVAGYTPNVGKAWDAVIKLAFDPSKPYFLGTDPGKNPAYYGEPCSMP